MSAGLATRSTAWTTAQNSSCQSSSTTAAPASTRHGMSNRAGKPGKVRKTRDYVLKPGDAHLYNEGDLHAPGRKGPTRLIRVEGTNMAKVTRDAYQAISD